MHNPDGLKQLLEELRDKLGSVARLAKALDLGERGVREWLSSADALRRIRPDNVQRIRDLALQHGFDPDAYVDAPELWDIKASFDANVKNVPSPPVGGPALPSLGTSFLGREIVNPFGPSASVLTASADFVYFHAQTGSGVITYKTVRTRPFGGHPWPNIYYCDPATQILDPDSDLPVIVVGEQDEEGCFPRNGMLNRFGVPAKDWETIAADFARARDFISSEQLLILSVMGAAATADKTTVLVDDFVEVTTRAVALRAEVIELNLSCPNCEGKEGLLFEDLRTTRLVCRTVREANPGAKILLKIGYMHRPILERFVASTAPYVSGYTLINTVPAKGIRKGGQHDPVWAPGKPAGLSGHPIRRFALRAVQNLAEIRAGDSGLASHGIIGVGGIETPQDVELYRSSGADVVQATTAFFHNSLFALRVYRHLASNSLRNNARIKTRVDEALANWVEAFHEAGLLTRTDAGAAAAGRVFNSWRVTLENTMLRNGPKRSTSVPSAKDFLGRIETEADRQESRSSD